MWLRNSLLGLLALAGPLLVPVAALAGDRALLEVIGYSRDARYIAFEEYGIEDGSGFAYSNLYVVDLNTDQWVVGTPIRLKAEREEESLLTLRAEVRAEALDRMIDLEIDQPAQVAALRGDGTIDTDGFSLQFGVPGYAPDAISGAYTVSLEMFDAPAALACADWMDSQAQGFVLQLKNDTGAQIVHRDDSLPRSRGCPVTYRIFGVYLPYYALDISRAVAIVSVFAHGFEGPDRRFVAVPLAAAE